MDVGMCVWDGATSGRYGNMLGNFGEEPLSETQSLSRPGLFVFAAVCCSPPHVNWNELTLAAKHTHTQKTKHNHGRRKMKRNAWIEDELSCQSTHNDIWE